MALATKYRAGKDVFGLIHHSDRGVQCRGIRYGETLAESQVVASVGSRGDAYDNATAEALNSVYKAELIDRKTWSRLIEVMAETSMEQGAVDPMALLVSVPLTVGGTALLWFWIPADRWPPTTNDVVGLGRGARVSVTGQP